MPAERGLTLLMTATVAFILALGALVVSAFFYLLEWPLEWAAGVLLLFLVVQWWAGPRIVESIAHPRPLREDELRWLSTMLKELCGKAGIPVPRLAVVEDESPNAFVYGRTQGSSTLAVHRGLLKLGREEIRGVLAHEVGHLRNRDCMIITLVSSIPLMLYSVSRGMLRQSGGSTGGGVGGSIFGIMVLGISLILYALYTLTHLSTLWLSRRREYHADKYSAQLTESPHPLQAALAQITYGLCLKPSKDIGLRSFCIGDTVTARKEITSVIRDIQQYDLDGDGRIDENELQIAIHDQLDVNRDGVVDEQELKAALHYNVGGFIARLNEMLATHPPTHKRIKALGGGQ